MKRNKLKLLSLAGLLLVSLSVTACGETTTSSSLDDTSTVDNTTSVTDSSDDTTTSIDVPPTPEDFSYYQNTHFDTSTKIQLIDQELGSNDRLYTAQAIQGLFARKSVKYYVDSTYVTNGTNTDLYYLEQASEKYDFEYESVTLTKAVQDYVDSWDEMIADNTWGSQIPLESYNSIVGVTAYTETSGEGYSTPGIRVTHVDARVYSTDRSTYLTNNVEEGVDFRCDNSKFGRSGITPYGSNDFWPSAQGSNTGTSFALITLIESSIKSDNGLTMYNYTADESALFTDGDVFRITDSNNVWSSVYMPSGENLWNKAKVITEWNSNGSQKFTIDETQKMDISLRVNEIVKDEEYGYKALITINTLNGESLE